MSVHRTSQSDRYHPYYGSRRASRDEQHHKIFRIYHHTHSPDRSHERDYRHPGTPPHRDYHRYDIRPHRPENWPETYSSGNQYHPYYDFEGASQDRHRVPDRHHQHPFTPSNRDYPPHDILQYESSRHFEHKRFVDRHRHQVPDRHYRHPSGPCRDAQPQDQDEISFNTIAKAIQKREKGSERFIIGQLANYHNINACDNDSRRTFLHLAAESGSTHIVKYLLRQKDIECKRDKYGDTPLHLATRKGHKDCMIALLEQFPEAVNIDNFNKWTPLHEAVNFSDDRMTDSQHLTKIMLSYCEGGANVNLRNRYGLTPLHIASGKGDRKSVSALLSQKDIEVDAPDINGETPLHQAARNPILATQALLANAGANPMAANKTGYTPIRYAVKNNFNETVEALLHNRDLNIRDTNGQTPLHIACTYGCIGIAKALIKKGADPLATDNNLRTPLHTAATAGYITFFDQGLFEGMKDVSPADAEGETPLHLALINNHTSVAIKLIQLGADINKANRKRLSPKKMILDARPELLQSICEELAKGMKNVSPADSKEAVPPNLALENIQALNNLYATTNSKADRNNCPPIEKSSDTKLGLPRKYRKRRKPRREKTHSKPKTTTASKSNPSKAEATKEVDSQYAMDETTITQEFPLKNAQPDTAIKQHKPIYKGPVEDMNDVGSEGGASLHLALPRPNLQHVPRFAKLNATPNSALTPPKIKASHMPDSQCAMDILNVTQNSPPESAQPDTSSPNMSASEATAKFLQSMETLRNQNEAC